MTEAKVLGIRKAYKLDQTLTCQSLADRFGCTSSTVSDVLRHRYWKHVKEAA